MNPRSPAIRIYSKLIVDNFAGGGGASHGIARAVGRDPDIAINHSPEAIAMHQANHPTTRHYCGDVWEYEPQKLTQGKPVGLAWFSPDCRHFSRSKGAKPRSRKIRALAWVAIRWAREVKPDIICLENVPEFEDWGPLDRNDKPIKEKRGVSFRIWLGKLKAAGYEAEYRTLKACDYGAPTIRKRFFLIARCDGRPIVWPKPTHGPGLKPYRTAAEIIDWSIPCPSIFGRKKPLAEATLKRIARGIEKFVLSSAKPFVIPLTHQGDARVYDIHEPVRTITGAHRGEMSLITPMIAPVKSWSGGGNEARGVDEPMRTITSSKRGEFSLIAPTLVQTGYGERPGQDPRALDLHKPLGTVVGDQKHALVLAFLAKHFGGGENGKPPPGLPMYGPLSTITARDHHAVVTSHLVKLYGSCAHGAPVTEPAPTVTAGGMHVGEVRTFLTRYNGTATDGQELAAPIGTLTSKPRFGLVTVHGAEYAIVDIGLRMLTPRELFRAQSFGDDYIIDLLIGGKRITKEAQIKLCGNAVPPDLSEAIAAAQIAA